MPARYRAIFFDLDGTLLDERHGAAEARTAANATLRAHGYPLPYATFNAAVQEIVDQLLAAHGGNWPAGYSRPRLFEQVLRQIGVAPEPAANLAPRLAAAYGAARLEHLALLPGARALLRTLSRRRPLGLISNGLAQEQREKIRRCELTRYFSTIVISGEVGLEKPDTGIFTIALQRLGVGAAVSVHIGNSLTADVAGAVQAGMDSVWIDHGGAGLPAASAVQPTAIIRSLEEVGPLLDGP